MRKFWNWIAHKRERDTGRRNSIESFLPDKTINNLNQEDLNSTTPSSSEIFSRPPIDFEEFFESSVNEIETAMMRKEASVVLGKQRFTREFIQSDEMEDDTRIGQNLSGPGKGLFQEKPRRLSHTKSLNDEQILLDDEQLDIWSIGSMNEKVTRRKTSPIRLRMKLSKNKRNLPNVSVSFADEPTSSGAIMDGDTTATVQKLGMIQSSAIKCKSLQRLFDIPRSESPMLNLCDEGCTRKINLIAQRRQSQLQVVQLLSGRRTSTTLIPLTSAQIHLVRQLWHQVYVTKGPTVIGTALFYRMFFKFSATKNMLRQCALPVQCANYDSFFKAHAKATAELINQVVQNLDNLEQMTETLIRIGSIHAEEHGGQIPQEIWNLLAETFIDCSLEWGDRRCRNETVRKAWALITAFIVDKLKQGHNDARILKLRRSSMLNW